MSQKKTRAADDKESYHQRTEESATPFTAAFNIIPPRQNERQLDQ